MEMVWDQRPSVALGAGFFEDRRQADQELIPVMIIVKNLPALISPGDNEMKPPALSVRALRGMKQTTATQQNAVNLKF